MKMLMRRYMSFFFRKTMCIRTMFVSHSNIIVDFIIRVFHFMNDTFDFCSIKYFVKFMKIAHARFEFSESNVFETTLIDLIFSKII